MGRSWCLWPGREILKSFLPGFSFMNWATYSSDISPLYSDRASLAGSMTDVGLLCCMASMTALHQGKKF